RRRDRGERLPECREPGLVAQGRDQVAVGEQLEEGRNRLLLAEHRPSMAQASISFPRAMAIADHELTDEQKAITEMVRQFADNEIIPVAEEFDHEDKFPEAIVEQMKELGLFGVTIPEEYGGMGLDLTTYAMIVEELSRGWISISGVVNTHFIGS